MKTIQILIAATIFSASSLFGKEDQFKLTTKIFVSDLPNTKVTKAVTSKEFIEDAEFQIFCREMVQLDHKVEVYTLPSITLTPSEVATIPILSEYPVDRTGSVINESIGHNLTFKIDTADGELRLQGSYKRSDIDEANKPKLVTITTEEVIFDRECKPDTTILVSKGDMHIFITVSRQTEEKK